MDEGTAYYITLSELKEATNNFERKIGKGSFGSVYYGRMKDGKEVAVKSMTDSSSHGNQQFVNEVVFKIHLLIISEFESLKVHDLCSRPLAVSKVQSQPSAVRSV